MCLRCTDNRSVNIKQASSQRLYPVLLFCRRYENSHGQLPEAKLERLFLYCLCWSLGGLLGEKERPAFDAELRSIGGSSLPTKYVQSEC